jgi:hypothetical protein
LRPSYIAALAALAFAGFATAASASDWFSSQPPPPPSAPIRGVGYAAISSQPGKSHVQKTLMAIRASRLMAMRELAEKIYGLDVNSYSSLSEGVMQADTLRGNVQGLVRSARTVSIGPIKRDIYETILEVDASDMVAMVAEQNHATAR